MGSPRRQAGSPKPRATGRHPSGVTHVLWRQDDNGNRVRIGTFDSLATAEGARDTLEARGHKQLYWIESVEDEPAS